VPEFVKPEVELSGVVTPFNPGEIERIQYLKQLTGVKLFDDDSVIALALAYEGSRTEVIEKVKLRVQEQENDLNHKNDLLELSQMEARELQSEVVLLQTENQRNQSKIQYLIRRLQTEGDFEGAFSGIHSVELDEPQSFGEFLEVMSSFEDSGVIFTGDEDITAKLDEIDSQGQAFQNTWLCFNALLDYVESRKNGDFQGSIFDYLKNSPDNYRTVSAKKYAPRESETTMAQFGRLRNFPVPASVDESCSTEMQAHFKLGKIGIVSPRMHVLDNFDNDGHVYIGYIGPHLRTSGTN